MLKITPVTDKELQKEYCENVGIGYDADKMCYAAYDDGKFRGISLFRIVEKSCVIYNIRLLDGIDDYLAVYLLAKAPMSFCEQIGVKTAVFEDENKELAKKLEFVEKDRVYKVDLEGYFTTPCKKHGCDK